MLNETGVPEIQKAVMILHEMSEDEKTKELARMREKKIRDDESLFRTGVNEGIEKGIKEGRKEERAEVIAKMRKSGLSEEQIEKILNS